MGFRVEGVTEASLKSEVFVACLGLVHQPLVREFGSLESLKTGLKEQGFVPGLEAVSPQVQFAATPCIVSFLLTKEDAETDLLDGGGRERESGARAGGERGGGGGGEGGWKGEGGRGVEGGGGGRKALSNLVKVYRYTCFVYLSKRCVTESIKSYIIYTVQKHAIFSYNEIGIRLFIGKLSENLMFPVAAIS